MNMSKQVLKGIVAATINQIEHVRGIPEVRDLGPAEVDQIASNLITVMYNDPGWKMLWLEDKRTSPTAEELYETWVEDESDPWKLQDLAQNAIDLLNSEQRKAFEDLEEALQ